MENPANLNNSRIKENAYCKSNPGRYLGGMGKHYVPTVPAGDLRPLVAKIRHLWSARGLSQDALSQIMGVSQSRISKWFGGTGVPDAYEARRAADYFRVPLDWLTDDAAAGDPPALDSEAVVLSPAERKVIDLAHELCADDPDLRLARQRLLGVGQMPPPGPIQPAPGKSALEIEAAAARRRGPGGKGRGA